MKISYQEYLQFKKDYYNSHTDYQHQRFGQAFLNKFFPTVTDPDLFYCEDLGVAENMICNKYLIY